MPNQQMLSEPHRRAQSRLGGPHGALDLGLAAVVLGLLGFGVVMVYSASAVWAGRTHQDPQYYLLRQSIYAAAGAVVLLGGGFVPYPWYRRLTYPILLSSTALLAFVAFGFGHRAGGAMRWISIGPVHVQPAEAVKLALILWLSYSLSKKRDAIRSFSIGFLPHALVALLLMVLCLKEPDFGSAVMIGLLTFGLLFTAGAKSGYTLGAFLLCVPAACALIASSENRLRRVRAFLEPFKYRYEAGYQVAESLISFGSGKWFGVGLGDGRQKLFFLPEAHTDFISSVIGEELGFAGLMAVVAMYCLLLFFGFRVAMRAADDYGTYVATGITLFFGLQAFTNLAVALGMLPTKGLVLPFLSYGGSSLLVNCAAAGILLNISRSVSTTPHREASHSAQSVESAGFELGVTPVVAPRPRAAENSWALSRWSAQQQRGGRP